MCALVKPDGTSADYAEIRQRFGIEGLIVSPQHLFAAPDGTKLDRHEYWPANLSKRCLVSDSRA